MEHEILTTLVSQIFNIAAAVLASGLVTSLLTQVLKWKVISIPAQKYPVPTAGVLSLLVSAAAVYAFNAIPLDNWMAYVVYTAATLFVATQSYDIVKSAVDAAKDAKAN